MNYRFANLDDAPLLARLNRQLIDDEGHRNALDVAGLETRMRGWLSGEYHAVLFEDDSRQVAGYVLFRREPEHVYVRQFFVCREQRRAGVGQEAIAWLREHAWHDVPRLRLEVLVGNTSGIAFWRAVGFRDYCLVMETDN